MNIYQWFDSHIFNRRWCHKILVLLRTFFAAWPDLTWSPKSTSPKSKILSQNHAGNDGPIPGGSTGRARNHQKQDGRRFSLELQSTGIWPQKHEIYVYIHAIYTSTSRLWGSRYTWKLSMNWTQAPLWSRIESSTAKENRNSDDFSTVYNSSNWQQ